MTFSRPLVAVAAFGLSMLFPLAATASTSVVVDSWLLKYSAEECIRDAVKAAKRSGFGRDHEVINYGSKKQNRILYASSTDGPYALAFSCEESDGTIGLAVSGLNSNKTFEMYESFLDAFESP